MGRDKAILLPISYTIFFPGSSMSDNKAQFPADGAAFFVSP